MTNNRLFIPMLFGFITAIGILVFVKDVEAQTFNGYLENFTGDSGIPTANWYNYTGTASAQFLASNGALRTSAGGTCSGATSCAFYPSNATLGPLFTSNDWSLDWDMTGSMDTIILGDNPDQNPDCDWTITQDFRNSAGTVLFSVTANNRPMGGGTPGPTNKCNSTLITITGCAGQETTGSYVSGGSWHGTVSFSQTGNMLTIQVTGTQAGYSCTQSTTNGDLVRAFRSNFGGGTSINNDSRSWDNYVLNLNNGATFTIEEPTETLVGAEFDSGLTDFATGIGFRTEESKLMFSLILIAITEIIMAFLVGFFSPGKWQVWSIHAVAATVGTICWLLGYLNDWILIVGIVLGTTITNGARESINTFKSLATMRGKTPTPDVTETSAGVPVAAQEAPRPSLEGQESEPEEVKEEPKHELMEESVPEPEKVDDGVDE